LSLTASGQAGGQPKQDPSGGQPPASSPKLVSDAIDGADKAAGALAVQPKVKVKDVQSLGDVLTKFDGKNADLALTAPAAGAASSPYDLSTVPTAIVAAQQAQTAELDSLVSQFRGVGTMVDSVSPSAKKTAK
jgi:hypothetical protein